jgi:hypothetical protein
MRIGCHHAAATALNASFGKLVGVVFEDYLLKDMLLLQAP